MKINNKVLISFITSFFLFIAGNAWATAPSTNINKKDNKNYLFIQTAKSGSLETTDKSGVYQLKLNRIEPYVTYFTDRPNRSTGLVALENFLEGWKQGQDSFAKDAPNGGLTGNKLHWISNGQEVKMVLELKDPSYDAKTHTLTYTAIAIANNKAELPKSMKIAHPALFVDSSGVCFGCGGGGF